MQRHFGNTSKGLIRQFKLNQVRKIIICGALPVFFVYGCSKQFELKYHHGKNVSASELNEPASFQPNIILILADDVGYEIPAYTGGQSYSTPNIDKMMQNGMHFTNCNATPLCSPSRFMLLTGKYNFRNYTQWGNMDRSQKTIANMLKDAGYSTCYAGKWQLNGGDTSIRTFGFDEYCVFNPHEAEPFHPNWRRYKDPDIFVNGSYLPKSVTAGKYSENFFTDSIFSFMDRHQEGPFFVFYSMSLCHGPFYPTPDDPEFAAWKPGIDVSDTRFYPSMVKYMDKKIGQVIDKVDQMGIANKTVIIYIGDNGTDNKITSLHNGQTIRGGKGYSTQYGTNVPMVVKWQGVVPPDVINSDLVDFTDFFPTLADISQKPRFITRYVPIDGVSFYQRLFRKPGTPRSWIFCHFNPFRPTGGDTLKRWIQSKNYKLYELTDQFYDCPLDPYEKSPVPESQMNYRELRTKKYFDSVLVTLN